MSLPTLSREAVREIDRRAIEEFHIPGIVLMENAGRGCADILCQIEAAGPVVICCGKGNNAGDGLVLARHLDQRGIATQLLFWSDPAQLQGDAAVNFEIATRARLPLAVGSHADPLAVLAPHLAAARWIVDALLGTGAVGEPRPPFDQIISRLNACPARKLALDIPSGLDCDTGQFAAHPFRADHTCTFVAAKPGLLVPSAHPWVGQLHVLDIGIPRALLEQFGLPPTSIPAP
jgi:NAD(P)H-hydrate epimerase